MMSTQQADIIFHHEIFYLTGNLHFSNVMSVLEKSLSSFKKLPALVFDFSRLEASDSSGLALILEWIKLAKQYNKSIQFISLPKDLMEIAKAASLDKIINQFS